MQFTIEQEKQVAVAALRRYEILQRKECFDPYELDSRPTAGQLEILTSISDTKVRAVISGNQGGKCLATGTLVATPTGPVPIEDLQSGDIVYSEIGHKIKVIGKEHKGKQVVHSIQKGKRLIANATASHRWLTTAGEIVNTESIKNQVVKIKRVQVLPEMGAVDEPHAYAIGVFLGDGCSKENALIISSENKLIPEKVASDLGDHIIVKRSHPTNYSWILQSIYKSGNTTKRIHCNHYDAWCNNKYAHEKLIDLDVTKTWNRKSLVKILAGLLDTDGSIERTFKNNPLAISWGMQAQSVIKAIQWMLKALYLHDCVITLDNRSKYKNGPLFRIKSTNIDINKIILKELTPYLATDKKKYKKEYDDLHTRIQYNCSIRKDRDKIADTWDIEVDSETHLFLLADGHVSHNSLSGAREVAWLFQEDHPTFDRKTVWNTEPLLMIVMGQVGEQVESHLWNRKIKPFLNPGTYKEVKIGSALQRVVHKYNGNTIIFMSHHNASEARKTIQGYPAHYVWIDEMPNSLSLISEAMTRLQAKDGRLLLTFTPLVRNVRVQEFIENLDPRIGKKFKLHMLDNPIYKGREDEILARFANIPVAERNTRLRGDWYVGDSAVYKYNPTTEPIDRPSTYSATWEHIESVDPAGTGKAGYVLAANLPDTNNWIVIKAKYFDGAAASDLLAQFAKESAGFNVIKRVCDPHEAWFRKEAFKHGLMYYGVYNKKERKMELLKNVQEAFGKGRLLIWRDCKDLIQEITTCQWSESAEAKIINSSKYHLLDSLQYFLDNTPKSKPLPEPANPDPLIQHDIELRKIVKKKKEIEYKMRVKRGKHPWRKSYSLV